MRGFLALYLDFFLISSAVRLADDAFPNVTVSLLGQPMPWPIQIVVALILLTLGRLANISLGERLLCYALAEQPGGRRQWPNLLLGTFGFLSGIWGLLRLAEADDGMPFLFMVEETPLKIAAVALYGALYSWGGVMLLRFEHRAKLYNALVISATLPIAAINQLFSHDALVASIVARESRDQPFPPEIAEFFAQLSIIYTVVLVAASLAILYFCRERPAAERSLEGAPSGGA